MFVSFPIFFFSQTTRTAESNYTAEGRREWMEGKVGRRVNRKQTKCGLLLLMMMFLCKVENISNAVKEFICIREAVGIEIGIPIEARAAQTAKFGREGSTHFRTRQHGRIRQLGNDWSRDVGRS